MRERVEIEDGESGAATVSLWTNFFLARVNEVLHGAKEAMLSVSGVNEEKLKEELGDLFRFYLSSDRETKDFNPPPLGKTEAISSLSRGVNGKEEAYCEDLLKGEIMARLRFIFPKICEQIGGQGMETVADCVRKEIPIIKTIEIEDWLFCGTGPSGRHKAYNKRRFAEDPVYKVDPEREARLREILSRRDAKILKVYNFSRNKLQLYIVNIKGKTKSILLGNTIRNATYVFGRELSPEEIKSVDTPTGLLLKFGGAKEPLWKPGNKGERLEEILDNENYLLEERKGGVSKRELAIMAVKQKFPNREDFEAIRYKSREILFPGGLGISSIWSFLFKNERTKFIRLADLSKIADAVYAA